MLLPTDKVMGKVKAPKIISVHDVEAPYEVPQGKYAKVVNINGYNSSPFYVYLNGITLVHGAIQTNPQPILLESLDLIEGDVISVGGSNLGVVLIKEYTDE